MSCPVVVTLGKPAQGALDNAFHTIWLLREVTTGISHNVPVAVLQIGEVVVVTLLPTDGELLLATAPQAYDLIVSTDTPLALMPAIGTYTTADGFITEDLSFGSNSGWVTNQLLYTGGLVFNVTNQFNGITIINGTSIRVRPSLISWKAVTPP